MKMRKIEFELEGICPMMMDRFAEGKQPTTEKEYEKQAYEKVYRDDKGNIAIPSTFIKAAMRDASAELGKKMESRKRRENVRALLFIEPEFLSIDKKEPDAIDRRMVTRAGTRDKVTRVPAFRPLMKDWKASGVISFMEGLEPEFINEALVLAGIKKGIGSFRPEFGRFVVTKFEVIK